MAIWYFEFQVNIAFVLLISSLDYFIMMSTLAVFLAMIEVIYTAHLSTNGQLEKARKIDRNMRWIAPLIYFVVVTEIFFLRIWV